MRSSKMVCHIQRAEFSLQPNLHIVGWTRVGLNSTSYAMVVKLNSLVIVGENLSRCYKGTWQYFGY
jgi:hypothetical protein